MRLHNSWCIKGSKMERSTVASYTFAMWALQNGESKMAT